ncbi:YihY/virulence factor BrkB family protein [Paenibacillus hodogayensis]|uniref:YihY/virulence factor BrkB family protein n=1 Tax=Paenibacillus hodogayensis TaxID=279208 RepID=A0ABV5W4X3_9BACL
MKRMDKTKQLVKALLKRCREDEVAALGAQLSYYSVLAFFPFLIFVVSLIGFANLSSDDFMEDLILVLPGETGNTVSDIIAEVTANRSGTLMSIGMLTTIWAASNGMNALIKGLNKAYDRQESRPFWKVRGLAVLSTVLLAVFIPFVMGLLIFGKAISGYVFQLADYSGSFEAMWGIARYALPIVALAVVFLLLYWIVPDRKMAIREAVPGTLFTTFGLLVTSAGFSFYVNNFGTYTKTYGSLGGIIVLLIWLYMSAMIVMIGGEINAALAFDRPERRREERQSPYGSKAARSETNNNGGGIHA